jgi:hypothetical protein
MQYHSFAVILLAHAAVQRISGYWLLWTSLQAPLRMVAYTVITTFYWAFSHLACKPPKNPSFLYKEYGTLNIPKTIRGSFL